MIRLFVTRGVMRKQILMHLLLCNLLLAGSETIAQTYPTGFNQVQIATGLTNPTIMTQAPDGRIFIAQQNGVLRVFKNGALLSQPFTTLSVNSSGERGL